MTLVGFSCFLFQLPIKLPTTSLILYDVNAQGWIAETVP